MELFIFHGGFLFMDMTMYQTSEIGELAGALAAAQGAFTFAVLDANGGRGNRYATLQSVIAAIRPGLSANGIALVQRPFTTPDNNGVIVRTSLIHKSGQSMACEMTVPNDRMGGIQGMGSAITYAKRYALCAMVGIAADEDDDGEEAMRQSKELAQQKKKAEKAKLQEVRQKAVANNPDPPSPELFKAFRTALSKQGLTTREAVQNELNQFFKRELASSKELTADEVRAYLNSLDTEKLHAQQPPQQPVPEAPAAPVMAGQADDELPPDYPF